MGLPLNYSVVWFIVGDCLGGKSLSKQDADITTSADPLTIISKLLSC